MIILGLETSCDETGIAVYNSFNGIISEYTYTQQIHSQYGGTVPELASKDHFKKILKLILFTLKSKKLVFTDLTCIAYTSGPGLKNALLIGVTFGKIIAFSLNIPSIGVNHLKSHIIIALLFNKLFDFPILVLFLSGAHSFLLEMINFDEFFILGKTLDDSIGEVFDKISRSLKMVPSNGKMIEKFSKKKFRFINKHYPKQYNNTHDFSFSGIKSAVIRDISSSVILYNDICNISYNLQNTLIKIVFNKCFNLLSSGKYKYFILSGGVSANKELRLLFKNYSYLFNLKFFTQPIKYCTDNGAMIAFLGFIRINNNFFDKNFNIIIKPNLYI